MHDVFCYLRGKLAVRLQATPRLLFLLLTSVVFSLSSYAAAQVEPGSSQNTTAGTIHGTVLDQDGDFIVGAHLRLIFDASARTPSQQTTSDDDGAFTFTTTKTGAFTITVTAENFTTRIITDTHAEGQTSLVPPVVLNAATQVDIQVTFSQHELAAAEVKAEEHQRIAGFLPNFFVTYDWHAAPLGSKQKFELAWRSTFDPATLAIAGGIAGVQQAQNDFSGYGQGASGFGKRYGAVMANTVTGNLLGGAILPSLLHQDPRYFYKGTGTIRSRTLYAVSQAVICRGDNGKRQPNYSSVLGEFAAGGISNLYYPASNRNGVGLTLTNGLLGIVGDAVGNVVQEFLFRRITPHLPPGNSPAP